MKEKQPPIKQEKPEKETDYPKRHCGRVRNEQTKLMSQEEIKNWFELEGKTDKLNLGS